MAARRARFGHRDLVPYPGPHQVNGLPWPGIGRLNFFKEMQNMLGTNGGPFSQQPMVAVLQRAAAPDGDESRIADLGKNHEFSNPICQRNLLPMTYQLCRISPCHKRKHPERSGPAFYVEAQKKVAAQSKDAL